MPRHQDTTIFLDVDGVLAMTPERLYQDHVIDIAAYPRGVYDLSIALNRTHEEVWAHTVGNVDWWESLSLYPHAMDLIEKLSAVGNVVLATAPMHDPASVLGKVRWIQRHFGSDFRDYVITKRKDVLARPCAVLVDDYDVNIESFRRAGGDAVLFARPWNSGYTFSDDAVGRAICDVSTGLIDRTL